MKLFQVGLSHLGSTLLKVITFGILLMPIGCKGQQSDAVGIGNWVTFSANVDGGYRKSQMFAPDYNTGVFQWDSRTEFWLPPSRGHFSWGPYLRVAGLVGSRSDAWQNGWLGGPGVGLQMYPFSQSRFSTPYSVVGKVIGPLRIFAEYDVVHYWGPENSWRPHHQNRIGLDYWKAINVNEINRPFWMELWNGLYWQSGNEFTDKYDTVLLGNSGRFGIRKPGAKVVSAITPYVAIESSRTKQNAYYWDNRLLMGGGVRLAPSLNRFSSGNRVWLSRFVIYGEYITTAAYYGISAPSSVPRYDVRIGVSATLGDWYK